jgi:hypothetical protein
MAFFGNLKHLKKKENVITSHAYIVTNTQKNKILQSNMCTSYNEYNITQFPKG